MQIDGRGRNRLFFRDDDASCFKIPDHVEYMKQNGLSEMKLYLAEREVGVDHFFCKHFDEVGQRFQCGTWCQGYSPRNGKSGVCRHFGFTYEQTEKCFTLKI